MGKNSKHNFFQRAASNAVRGLVKSFDLNSMWLTGSEIPYDSISSGGIGDAYKSVSTAYSCIRRQAVDISSVPLLFLKDKDDINSKINTPIERLFERPNGWTSQEQFLQHVVIMTLLRGDMFVDFDNFAEPTKMFTHFDSDDWTEVVNKSTCELVGWHYKKSTTDFTRLPSEVLTHRLPSPYNAYRGQSPLTAARHSASIIKQTDSVHASITARGGESGVMYKTPQELTDSQYDQLLSRLSRRRRGVGQTSSDIILEGGLDVLPPGFTKADVDLLTLRPPAAETICEVYGMSPTLIGHANESNYSTFRGYLKIYWLQTLLPFMRGLENSFDRYFADRHGVHVRFDLRAVEGLQDYLTERKDTAKTFYQLGVPMNEINRRLNLGFDASNIIAGDECLMPVNMAPMSMLVEGKHIPVLAGSDPALGSTDGKIAGVTPSDNSIKITEIENKSQAHIINSDGESLPVNSPADRAKHPSIVIPSNRRVAKSAKKYKGLLRRELLGQKDGAYNQESIDDIAVQFANKAMHEGCIKALISVDDTNATWDELSKAVTIKSFDKMEDVFPDIQSIMAIWSDVDVVDEKSRKDAFNKTINNTGSYLNEIAELAVETGFQLQLIDLNIDIEKE